MDAEIYRIHQRIDAIEKSVQDVLPHLFTETSFKEILDMVGERLALAISTANRPKRDITPEQLVISLIREWRKCNSSAQQLLCPKSLILAFDALELELINRGIIKTED